MVNSPADYDALYRRLWQAILAQEGRIQGDAAAFVAALVASIQAEGWKVGPEAQRQLTDYLDGVTASLRAGIGQAVGLVMDAAGTAGATGLGSAGAKAVLSDAMRSEAVAKLTEQAFSARWPDGLTLSDRVWAWSREMRAGVERELQAGARAGTGINTLLYNMQRAIEGSAGAARFEIASLDLADWTDQLAQAGRALIHDPAARQEWQLTVNAVRRHIGQLKESGTRNAAVRAFKAITGAVNQGREDLLGKALHWWAYDKQLYLLKRIARTEMATAAHRAVIASTENDPHVIGYHWRLSGSHPAPDICDYYAGIEMGLGKGVWTKEAVPRHKAHPHCMCNITPRVTKIKTPGSTSYAEFIQGLPADKRAELLPNWANHLHGLGMPLEKLIRPDGLGLATRAEVAARMGEDRFHAAEALGKALVEREWPENRIKPGNRMGRATLDALEASRHIPEVQRYLAQLQADGYRTPSRSWHYFKYKYQYGDPLQSPAELDARFEAVLSDGDARVHRSGERYIIYSENAGRWAIVQPSGLRISVYRPTDDELKQLGEPLWNIHMLSD